ncbi:NYN domain-containing protein [Arthrobacter sp. GMC3]|uniref:NYN domain-containing protein n=1 Tax=Arthrobacter sp. GMC3 TaxID=2058894 RepID=UPI0011B0ABC7|nr:NYN domain-containing protein [Arthrobacter sp. GMC3]
MVRHRNMAVFIDLENLFGGYGRSITGVPLSAIVKTVQAKANLLGLSRGAATIRAYANWTHPEMSTYRKQMAAAGIEPVQVWTCSTPSSSGGSRPKNAADIQLVVDALAVAADAPWIDVFAIISGDGDFVPLVRRLQLLGKVVLGASVVRENAGIVSTQAPVVATPPPPKPVPDVSQKIVACARTPSKAEYVRAAVAYTQKYPNALVGGAVVGSHLGSLLKKRWPTTSYSTFGYKSFGSFVEEACNLRMHRPNTPKKTLVPAGSK